MNRISHFEQVEQRLLLTASEPLVILPVGDSITQAEYVSWDPARQRPSYRAPLQLSLESAGIEFEFVGSSSAYHNGTPPANFPHVGFDPDHEGHWGWSAEQFADGAGNPLAGWIANYEAVPDIALVHLGTNDIINALPAGHSAGVNDLTPAQIQSIAQEIEEVVDTLISNVDKTDFKVLLAQLIPGTLIDEEVQALNVEIAAIAAANSSVFLVDQYSQFDPTTQTYDALHPNASGEQHMADRWLAAIESASTSSTDVGDLQRGIAVDDLAQGTGYLMFSDETTHTRFPDLLSQNSDHFVAVRYHNNAWAYNNNQQWQNFVPAPGDRLLATVDFSADRIGTLQGVANHVQGIAAGYSQGDLDFIADQWNGVPNEGEFAVSGTYFEVGSSSSISLGNVKRGIAVDDAATGEAFVMFSQEIVQDRFPATLGQNSEHLVVVQNTGGAWAVNNNSQWSSFTPRLTDRLLARVNLTSRTMTSMQGASGFLDGIAQGFSGGDLTFSANQWNGVANTGEYTVGGSYFELCGEMHVNLGPLYRGVAVADDAVGAGFLLHSQEDVRTRFSGILGQNSVNFVAVQFSSATNEWMYNNNQQWIVFTPRSSDRLLAAIDFDGDTVASLQGTTGLIHGIQQGYSSGDLAFVADQWNGLANDGEFQVSGSFFLVSAV